MSLHTNVANWLKARVAAAPPLNSIGELNLVLRHLCKWRVQLLANTFVAHHGRMVIGGPFAGMAYVGETAEGAMIARLLGSYESELHPHLAAFCAEGLDCIVDVGCAEGYYAVGFARNLPDVTVYAYDIDPKARTACAQMAEANKVADRVVVRGAFQPADFAEFQGRRCLVFVDAEGAEDDLLDPAASPALAGLNLIVETHDGIRRGVRQRLMDRFAATHDIVRVDQQGKSIALPDWLRELGHLDQLLAVWEWRMTPTPWLVMRPKAPV